MVCCCAFIQLDAFYRHEKAKAIIEKHINNFKKDAENVSDSFKEADKKQKEIADMKEFSEKIRPIIEAFQNVSTQTFTEAKTYGN